MVLPFNLIDFSGPPALSTSIAILGTPEGAADANTAAASISASMAQAVHRHGDGGSKRDRNAALNWPMPRMLQMVCFITPRSPTFP